MDEFDFWYAVNNTEVVRLPVNPLETFGTTTVEYRLVTEQMDSIDRVRIREGRIEAARPTILTPGDFGSVPLEGFSDAESGKYVDWLKEHQDHLRIIQYGFNVSKTEIKHWDVHDPIEHVVANIDAEAEKEAGMVAVIRGVEQPWEVCLLKLMVELVEQSAAGHIQQFQEHQLIPGGEDHWRKTLEDDFLAASRDANRVGALHAKLDQLGVFSEYEDRFFALVRSHQ